MKQDEKDPKEGTEKTGGRTQKQSVNYALKAFSKHLRKLLDAGLIDNKDADTVIAIKTKAVNKYVEQEFN